MEKNMEHYFQIFAGFIFIILTTTLRSQPQPTGTIEGIVLDAAAQTPLIGVNVIALNTTLGAVSDENGKFIVKNIPVGNYTVQFRMIGYSPLTKTDVIVRPQRSTVVNAALAELAVESDQVVVTPRRRGV